MREQICLQCEKTCLDPVNRLVQDTCGHKKCRTCLLEDEQQCTQCEAESEFEIEDQVESDVLKCDTNGETDDVVLNNHTAVIQVNGGCPIVKKNSVRFSSGSVVEFEEDDKGSVESEKEDNEETFSKRPIDSFKIKKPDKIVKKNNPIDIPKHINVISDPPSYHCTICDKTFITKTHVKYHSYCAGGQYSYCFNILLIVKFCSN